MVDLSDDENSNEVISKDTVTIQDETIECTESKNDNFDDKKNDDASNNDNSKSVDETNNETAETYTHKIKKLLTPQKDKPIEEEATENADKDKVIEEGDSFDALIDQMNKNGDDLNSSVDSNCSFLSGELKKIEQNDIHSDKDSKNEVNNDDKDIVKDIREKNDEEVEKDCKEITEDGREVEIDYMDAEKVAENESNDVAKEHEDAVVIENNKSTPKKNVKSKRGIGRGRGKNK